MSRIAGVIAVSSLMLSVVLFDGLTKGYGLFAFGAMILGSMLNYGIVVYDDDWEKNGSDNNKYGNDRQKNNEGDM